MFAVEKNKLTKAVDIMQKALCQYRSDCCDCKYGANNFETGRHSGEECGCPELRLLVKILDIMTDEEYYDLLARAKCNCFVPENGGLVDKARRKKL